MADSVADTVPDLVEELRQWKISPPPGGKPGPVLANQHYNLKSREVRKFLQYEGQRVGINLGWTDDAEPETARKVSRWSFDRKDSQGGAIRYGDLVALKYGESFVKYEQRTWGINLGWSDTPVFEWQILGGKTGAGVQTTDWVALFNTTPDECLIFFDRTAGGDIGWPSSETWSTVIRRRIEKEAWAAAKQAALKALTSGAG